jgi:hypothetical protein
LLKAVGVHSLKYANGPMSDLKVCDSVAEVSRYKYFYEALLHFGWDPIPFGDKYEAWRDNRRRAMLQLGEGIYFLGPVLSQMES